MKIEILFPEFCNIYGDYGNVMYLKKCLPEVEFIETSINDEPKFIKEDIALVYMGSMTEKVQEKVIKKLTPYRDIMEKQIDEGKAFLFTGNSFEVFGKYIETDDKTIIDGIGLIETYSKRRMFDRYNSIFVGDFEDIEIIGFRDQFALQYGDNSETYFAKATRGIGLNKKTMLEGIRINNFIGTSILGPILVLNPMFTKYYLRNILKIENAEVAFEKDAMEAYEKRVKEFKDPKRSF